MTAHDDLFGARLASALAVEDRRDWLDVRRRAHRGRRRWLSRPTGLLAAALVIGGGGSLALGLGGNVPARVRAVWASPPVPPGPTDGAPPWSRLHGFGTIVESTEHRVVSLPTRRGVVSLYVARTSRGDLCNLTFGGGTGGGGCNVPHTFSVRDPIDLSLQQGAGYLVLSGRAGQQGADAVSIRFRGGPPQRIVLRESWFLYDAPPAHRSGGAHPIVAIDVLAGDGRLLGSLHDPLRLHPPAAGVVAPVPATVRRLAQQALPNGGGTVAIWDGRDARGRRCFRLVHAYDHGLYGDWDCQPRDASTPLRWELGVRSASRKDASYGWVYAYGWAASPVVSLKLRFQDGDQRVLRLQRGDFLYVVPTSRWRVGRRPSVLMGYDARGREVYRRFLYPRQHCLYPGIDPPCGDVRVAGTG